MSLAGYFMHLPPARKRELTAEMVGFATGGVSVYAIPRMLQDILEAGALPELPPKFSLAAQHYVDQGLCYFTGRRLQ